MVAAVKIAPDELTGSERAALVGMAEATPKGQRRSRATQEEIMSIAGLKSRNGIDKVVKSLVDRKLIRHERARFRHVAAYHLLFDEWIYDEEARHGQPPRRGPGEPAAALPGRAQVPELPPRHTTHRRMTTMANPSDARLWAYLTDEFRQAGAAYPDAAQRHARRAVALVRRERAENGARTYAPGDTVPYDVTRVYDLDGHTWNRQSTDPTSTLRDSWKMAGFDPDEHEPACQGVWITPFLLDEYGPLTEIRKRR